MYNYKNNSHLEGNLGKDAELKSTPAGDVVNFSIAVNEKWTDNAGDEQTRTSWFPIEVWGPLTKFASTLKAGTPIIVDGQLKPDTYESDGVKHKTFSIKADRINRLDFSQPAKKPAAAAGKKAK